MKQREVQDQDGIRWTCVQAMGGVSGEAGEEAKERVAHDDGTVPVVCTPSGGEQTMRIALEPGWEEQASDETLLEAIARARS